MILFSSENFLRAIFLGILLPTTRRHYIPFGICVHCLRTSTLVLSFKKKANVFGFVLFVYLVGWLFFSDLKGGREWQNMVTCSLSGHVYLDSVCSLPPVPLKVSHRFQAFLGHFIAVVMPSPYNV